MTISDFFKGLKNKLRDARTNILKIICVVYFFVIIIFIPNQIYTLIFLGVVYKFSDWLISKYYQVHYFQYHDFKTNTTAIRAMSMHEFSGYKVVDRLGEPFHTKYAFRAGKDIVFEVDSIDDEKKLITVNPIHTNLDVIRFAQRSADEFAFSNNKLFNKIMALEDELDYLVLRGVAEKLASNKVIKAMRGEEVKTMKEERIAMQKEQIKEANDQEKATKLENEMMNKVISTDGGKKI